MAKFSDYQRTILSKAAQRDDGVGEVPVGIKRAAATRLGASLVAHKLMREIRSKPSMPVWRKDENDRAVSLVLLRAGRVAADSTAVKNGDPEPKQPHQATIKPKTRTLAVGVLEDSATGSSPLPRAGSKQAFVIEMLSRETGATLDALVKATGWLPHTTRAALTGLRKRGFAVERDQDDRLGSVYRIIGRKAA